MPSSFKEFKSTALAKPAVKAAYNELEEEYAFLEEVLKARKKSGLTQAELAEKIGTSQSAIARLESTSSGHSPSISTLQKYARALGCKLQIKLVRVQSQ